MIHPTPEDLLPPGEAIAKLLGLVDQNMAQVAGRSTTDQTHATAAYSQVYAICALVHAVRELTEELRAQAARAHGSGDG